MWLSEQWVYFDVGKYEDKGTYASGRITGKEKGRDGEVKYSRFFCQFRGDAYKKISANPNIVSFKIKMATISNAPWIDKNGEKQYPKTFTMTIIDVTDINYANDANPF